MKHTGLADTGSKLCPSFLNFPVWQIHMVKEKKKKKQNFSEIQRNEVGIDH